LWLLELELDEETFLLPVFEMSLSKKSNLWKFTAKLQNGEKCIKCTKLRKMNKIKNNVQNVQNMLTKIQKL
jgi:hypothetical protein